MTICFSFNKWFKYVLLVAGDIMMSKTDMVPLSSVGECREAEMTAVQCEMGFDGGGTEC